MPSKSTISDVLEELLNDLAQTCKRNSEKLEEGKQAIWMQPPNAEEVTTSDWPALHSLFSSDKPNQELLDSVNPQDPGNSGDLILTNTQIDYLSTMERAFRARHTMTFPRNVAHHMGRKAGEGSDSGPLKYGVLDYLKEIKKVAAGSS
jgi:hypothetical protein